MEIQPEKFNIRGKKSEDNLFETMKSLYPFTECHNLDDNNLTYKIDKISSVALLCCTVPQIFPMWAG
jgi:hypothetical protein